MVLGYEHSKPIEMQTAQAGRTPLHLVLRLRQEWHASAVLCRLNFGSSFPSPVESLDTVMLPMFLDRIRTTIS